MVELILDFLRPEDKTRFFQAAGYTLIFDGYVKSCRMGNYPRFHIVPDPMNKKCFGLHLDTHKSTHSGKAKPPSAKVEHAIDREANHLYRRFKRLFVRKRWHL